MYNKTNIHNVSITDGFWKEKRDLLVTVTEPYIWKALNNEIYGAIPSCAIENFEIASGKKNKEFHGLVSQDSDLFKWLEAASFAVNISNDKMTKNRIDSTITLLQQTQQKDGYLNTYYILNGLKNKWSYLKESCQLYCAGHLIEAAVSYYQVTGKDELLKIACDYADCIDRTFGREESKIHGYDGHAEIELALFRLYEVTGNERYKTLGEDFVEMRGTLPYFFDLQPTLNNVSDNLAYELKEDDYHHSQSHLPIRQQKEATGHAVKAMYFYTAVADLARFNNDKILFETLNSLWNDVTEKKMYITGAIGSSSHGESFTYAYDLPSDLMYGETCASIALFIFAYHMLQIDNNSKYADVMERALYNGILCGISESGTKFFYTNPLEINPDRCKKRKEYEHIEVERQPWFECPCCPPNITRLILSLNNYIYTYDDLCINVHHYISSESIINNIKIIQETKYPQNGDIKFQISVLNQCSTDVQLEIIRFRIPFWCSNMEISVDDTIVDYSVDNGYAVITENWNRIHKVFLRMGMEIRKIYANEKINGLQGKVSVMRGPVVFCAEEIDNGKLDALFLKTNGRIEEAFDDNTAYQGFLVADGYRYHREGNEIYSEEKPTYEDKKIIFIPYHRWNNRSIGEMKVFLSEK